MMIVNKDFKKEYVDAEVCSTNIYSFCKETHLNNIRKWGQSHRSISSNTRILGRNFAGPNPRFLDAIVGTWYLYSQRQETQHILQRS